MGLMSKGRTASRMALNGIRTFVFRQLDRPPIIIGGCGRSGTTLLLSVLSAHERIMAVPFETYCFCPVPETGTANPDVSLDVGRFYRKLLSHRIPESCHRWCEKTPKNVVYFGKILERFGSSVRLLHIVRDGRDVVTSSHPNDSGEYYVSPERWIFDVSAGLSVDDHPQVMRLRYEDLVQSFSEVLESLGEFLDEDFGHVTRRWYERAEVREHEAWERGEVSPLHSDSVGRWRAPEHEERVTELMERPRAAPLLEELGYS